MITETTGILTAADIKALRSCDQIGLRHLDGEATIEPIWDSRKKKPRYGIAVISRFQQHGKSEDIIADPYDNAKCFCLAYAYEVSPARTAILCLKTGDKVKIVWTRDNNNQYIEKSVSLSEHTPTHDNRLHVDTVDILVERRVGKRIVTLVFRIETSIVPDNTARMIQRA